MGTGRYTTKGRVKRIQLDYFKRLHPFRRWRLILSVAAPVLVALALAGFAVRGTQRIYNSGPVSTAHAMFGTQCGDCHVPVDGKAGAGGFLLRPSNASCSACHAGPIHHENQVGPQICTSCHVEHQGRAELAALPDHHCTRCHASLTTTDARPPQFATKVSSFDHDHPEFAVTVKDKDQSRRIRLDQAAELKDVSQIKLNHKKHLETGLQGLQDVEKLTGMRGLVRSDKGLALGCTYCHETDDRRAQMKPVAYARHCAACHPLDFDGRFAGATVPHDTPSLVHAFLRTALLETFEKCQALPPAAATAPPEARQQRTQCEALGLVKAEPETGPAERKTAEPAPEQPRGRRLLRGDAPEEPPAERPRAAPGTAQEAGPGASAPGRPAASALDWTASLLPNVESFTFKQRCELCHVMTTAAGRLPDVAPPAMPVRWLPHSVFDHGVHRPVRCTECHKAATASTETADVLLPSIKVCRECHRSAGGARAGCVECHVHHDKSKERDLNGPLTIDRLVKGKSR